VSLVGHAPLAAWLFLFLFRMFVDPTFSVILREMSLSASRR
jgi:hypothetical protein